MIDETKGCFFKNLFSAPLFSALLSSASPASRPEHCWDHRRNKTPACATISNESGGRSIRTKRGTYGATASKSQAKMECRAGRKRQGADTLIKKWRVYWCQDLLPMSWTPPAAILAVNELLLWDLHVYNSLCQQEENKSKKSKKKAGHKEEKEKTKKRNKELICVINDPETKKASDSHHSSSILFGLFTCVVKASGPLPVLTEELASSP